MYICDICGKSVPNIILHMKSEELTKFLCPSCAQYSGTCYFCANGPMCAFEQSSINIPKVEEIFTSTPFGQRVKAQIKNKQRIKETCEKNCLCWNKTEKYCNKENLEHTCSQYYEKE